MGKRRCRNTVDIESGRTDAEWPKMTTAQRLQGAMPRAW